MHPSLELCPLFSGTPARYAHTPRLARNRHVHPAPPRLLARSTTPRPPLLALAPSSASFLLTHSERRCSEPRRLTARAFTVVVIPAGTLVYALHKLQKIYRKVSTALIKATQKLCAPSVMPATDVDNVEEGLHSAPASSTVSTYCPSEADSDDAWRFPRLPNTLSIWPLLPSMATKPSTEYHPSWRTISAARTQQLTTTSMPSLCISRACSAFHSP